MKPDKIDWIKVSIFGEYPSINELVMVSYNTSFYGFTSAATEAYYGVPYIDRPDIKMTKEDQDFFDQCGRNFYDKHGKPIVSVYAWARKPKCMLGNNGKTV